MSKRRPERLMLPGGEQNCGGGSSGGSDPDARHDVSSALTASSLIDRRSHPGRSARASDNRATRVSVFVLAGARGNADQRRRALPWFYGWRGGRGAAFPRIGRIDR